MPTRFAPLDLPRKATYASFVRLFTVLQIPDAFTLERVDSVSHSLGTHTDPDRGSCLWFHFLCKHVHVVKTTPTPSIMYHPGADLTKRNGWFEMHRPRPANTDFSYVRAGFFLRTEKSGEVTLVCFGAPITVRSRMEKFLDARAWGDVAVEPYVLLDLVLEGLYREVDENVWNIADVLGPLEHQLLTGTHVADSGFAAIQNLGKNISYLGEGVEAMLLVVDGLISRMEAALQTISTSHTASTLGTSQQQQQHAQSSSSSTRSSRTMTAALTVEPPRPRGVVLLQLIECLSHRRSLLRSTKLRLGSLRNRIANAINLSFNLLTQRDSRLMIVVAAITVMFLPLTAVASVVGSQIFTSSKSEAGAWVVETTPLFSDLWYVTVPLTVAVVMVAWALGWHRPQLLALARAVKAVVQITASYLWHAVVDLCRGRRRSISPVGVSGSQV